MLYQFLCYQIFYIFFFPFLRNVPFVIRQKAFYQFVSIYTLTEHGTLFFFRLVCSISHSTNFLFRLSFSCLPLSLSFSLSCSSPTSHSICKMFVTFVCRSTDLFCIYFCNVRIICVEKKNVFFSPHRISLYSIHLCANYM